MTQASQSLMGAKARRTNLAVSLVLAGLLCHAGPALAQASPVQADSMGDGRADLAVGVWQEDVEAVSNAGAVQVLYGSASGLDRPGNQLWHQDVSGIVDAAEAGDQFGFALATGDFNGDGLADLAVGVPGEDVAGVSDAGAVQVLYGTPSGLERPGNQFWHQG
jgi:FG-GAP repeat